jgi:hypothetical protein
MCGAVEVLGKGVYIVGNGILYHTCLGRQGLLILAFIAQEERIMRDFMRIGGRIRRRKMTDTSVNGDTLDDDWPTTSWGGTSEN